MPTNALDWPQVLSMAVRHRRVGSHELNMESSRSHSIFTGGLRLMQMCFLARQMLHLLRAFFLLSAAISKQLAWLPWLQHTLTAPQLVRTTMSLA